MKKEGGRPTGQNYRPKKPARKKSVRSYSILVCIRITRFCGVSHRAYSIYTGESLTALPYRTIPDHTTIRAAVLYMALYPCLISYYWLLRRNSTLYSLSYIIALYRIIHHRSSGVTESHEFHCSGWSLSHLADANPATAVFGTAVKGWLCIPQAGSVYALEAQATANSLHSYSINGWAWSSCEPVWKRRREKTSM